MTHDSELVSAEALRRDFDARFRIAHAAPSEARETVLVGRSGDRRFAFRSADLSALAPLPAFATLPSLHAAVMGIVSIRASVVVVYDLESLASGAGTKRTSCRWLVVPSRYPTVGFAFEALEGLFDVPRATLDVPPSGTGESSPGSLVVSGSTCTLVDVGALLASIEAFTGAATEAPGAERT
jgi:chemotaxis signal transduction protein